MSFATNLIGGLGILYGFFNFFPKTNLGSGQDQNIVLTTPRVDIKDLHSVAKEIIDAHGLDASPEMIAAMALVESGDIYHPESGADRMAYRYEAHIKDASIGVMQTLIGTAQWLYDIGYKSYPRPTKDSLYNAKHSIYFGAAYVDWLANYKGVKRSESWIVQSYNAGPNNSANHHLQKYYTAKDNLKRIGVV